MKPLFLSIAFMFSTAGFTMVSKPQQIIQIIQDSTQQKHTFSQYYKLQQALKNYETIAERKGWAKINVSNDSVWKSGSRSTTIRLVRTRLFAENYLSHDSQSDFFDDELLAALNKYKGNHLLAQDSVISGPTIASMNIPVEDRIKTIRVNLERSRLVEVDENGKFIAVNIPSFTLYYFKAGQPVLTSRVVVGKEATKTVVFNDTISQVVFNPYWNIPKGIAQNELLPAIRKNRKLFAQMNLEWHNGKLRQKPGKDNSLGLVKFIFPNSNNIYLHDTPSKSLFKEEKRTFSHGCIRVEKACELAAAIMADELGWTETQTLAAMDGVKQEMYNLQHQIPIYIGYFTAWVTNDRHVAFYPDVYGHDDELVQTPPGKAR